MPINRTGGKTPTPPKSSTKASSRPTNVGRRPTTTPTAGMTMGDSYLSRASREAVDEPRGIILVGGSGLGKTSLAAEAPAPFFICDSQEMGINDLKRRGLVDASIPVSPPVENWQMLLDICDEIITTGVEHGIQTAVFESITGFEKFAFQHHCNENYHGNMSEFMSFSKGPKATARHTWPGFLDKLQEIRHAGMHVILTGHSRVKPKDNAEGADFSAEVAYCDPETWQHTHRWAETVLMLVLSPVEETKSGGKVKMAVEGQRMLYMHKTPIYDAKNRWGITTAIPITGGSRETFHAICKAGDLDPATFFTAT